MVRFIPFGYDCSPASALRALDLRDVALPFDWVESRIEGIEECLREDFKKFHQTLFYNRTNTRMVDEYLFQFPHDYPFNTSTENFEKTLISDELYGERNNDSIIDNWKDYHDKVLEKYNRRIERFRNITRDSEPIIVLCRYGMIEKVYKLQELFSELYNNNNVYFINSHPDSFETDKILCICTEKNGNWNDSEIWKQGIEHMKQKYEL